MSKAEHTPTPWRRSMISACLIEHGERAVASTNIHSRNDGGKTLAENAANLEFILRACNSYERMKKDLKYIQGLLSIIKSNFESLSPQDEIVKAHIRITATVAELNKEEGK